MLQNTLNLQSTDWGLANLNPMVRAYGLKKDRSAKCHSCYFYREKQCAFLIPTNCHDPQYRACTKYKNRKQLRKEESRCVQSQLLAVHGNLPLKSM